MGVKFFLILCLGAILQDAMGNLSKRSYNPKFRHVNKKYLKAIPSEFEENNERDVMEEMYLLDTKTNKLTKTDVVLVSMGMESSSMPLDKAPTDFPNKAYNKHSTLGHQKTQQKPTFSQDDSMMLAQPQINGPPIVLQLLGWSGNPPPPLVLPQMPPKVEKMDSVKPIMESIEMPVGVNGKKKPDSDSMILLIEDDQKDSMKKPAEIVELKIEQPQMMPVSGQKMLNSGSVVGEEKKPAMFSDQMAAESMIFLVDDDQKNSMKEPEEIVELKFEQPQMFPVSGEQMPNSGSVVVEEKKPLVLSDQMTADSMILVNLDDQKDSMKKPEEIFEMKVDQLSMMPVVVDEKMPNMASNKQKLEEVEKVEEPQVMLVSQEKLSSSASEKKESSESKKTEEAPLTLVAPTGSLPKINETKMPVSEIVEDIKADVEKKIAAMDQKKQAIDMDSKIQSTDIKVLVEVEGQKKPEIEKISASKEEMKISAMDEQPMKVSVPVPEMILIENNEKKPEAILVPEILTEVNNKKPEIEKMTTEKFSEEEIKKTDSMVEKPDDKPTPSLISMDKVLQLLFCYAELMHEVSVSGEPFKPAFSLTEVKASNRTERLERCKKELEKLKRKNAANSMTVVPQETMKPVTNTNESLMNKDQELAVKEPFQKPAASAESASEHKPATVESNSDMKVKEESPMKDESVIVVKPVATQKPIRRKRPNHHKPKPHRPRPTKKPAASSTTTSSTPVSSTTTAESSSAEQSSTASPSSTTSAEASKV